METSHCYGARHLTVDISPSLLGALESFSESLCLSNGQGFSRIFEGLPGLDPSELGFFKEPPRRRRSSVSFRVSGSAISALDECSVRSGLSRSSICRRILHGLLFTQEIGFIGFTDNNYLLRRTQLVFLFPEETQLPPS